jgi:alpha-L-fucosidase
MAFLGLIAALAYLGSAAARAIPSPQQLAWQGQFGAIIHYNMATWAHHQGCSPANWHASSDPKLFGVGLNGVVDTDSWGAAMAAANMTYAVYVAKHNCGFTTWPTRVTLPDGTPYAYSVQNSSCPDCDVVASFLATCKKYGIRPGFYYSLATNTYLNVEGLVVHPNPQPGMASVTQRQFYDIALAQLGELWSYPGAEGALFEVWCDGGLPQDPYFGAGITALLEKHQPQAVVFNGWPVVSATAARWIGNEAGAAPDPTWSSGSCGRGNEKCTDCAGGNGGDPADPDWCPAEVDATLQLLDTWFYVEGLPLHPLKDLSQMVVSSLGRNANLLLDIAPPPNSTVAAAHLAGYAALGDWLRSCLGSPLASASLPPGATSLTLPLPAGARVTGLYLREDQRAGQLVRNYTVAAPGGPAPLAAGTSVGSGKIDVLASPLLGAASLRLDVGGPAPPTGLTLQALGCAFP